MLFGAAEVRQFLLGRHVSMERHLKFHAHQLILDFRKPRTIRVLWQDVHRSFEALVRGDEVSRKVGPLLSDQSFALGHQLHWWGVFPSAKWRQYPKNKYLHTVLLLTMLALV